ncbi:hypothetical protein BC826DRAFT_986367 [Russula brevipes]|nr:hypothetical protein BC826DRAFT_986367 [Russula brevipes]
MTREPLPLPTSHYQYDSVQNLEVPTLLGCPNQESWRSERPPPDFTRHGPVSHVNHAPPAICPGMGYDDPPNLTTMSLADYRGHENHRGGHTTPRFTPHVPVAPDPARLECSDLVVPPPWVPNNGPLNFAPLPHNGAGDRGSVLLGNSAAEDLKRLAGHYLHSPGSQVDKLRMRRSRSGGLKVLIMLEIGDTE